MKKKVLIIVENATVPFDTRVWKEASSLFQNGYEVTVLCPRGQGYRKGYEVMRGSPYLSAPACPMREAVHSGTCWEYWCALFWEFLYAWWIYLRQRISRHSGLQSSRRHLLRCLAVQTVRSKVHLRSS